MKKPQRLLFIFFLIVASSSFSQKLKKADRIIAENIQLHITRLSGDGVKMPAGVHSEPPAYEYLISQLKKNGCKPVGDSSTYFQKFKISDGKEINAATQLSINGKGLILHTEYFPFAFSASKEAEASVAKELAENGVPWFADLKELLDNDERTTAKDTTALIRARAKRAASKGATALVVFNGSAMNDLVFNSLDTSVPATIPVLYVARSAGKKYLPKESSLLDIKLNVSLRERRLDGYNIAGYLNNGADSIVITSAGMGNEKDVAELIELSKLLRNKQYRGSNYLFIVYPSEKKGAGGINYFNDHPVIDLQHVNYKLNLDSLADKGLPAVKQSIDAINALRTHEAKARP
jgi:aminopeptidase YwaD